MACKATGILIKNRSDLIKNGPGQTAHYECEAHYEPEDQKPRRYPIHWIGSVFEVVTVPGRQPVLRGRSTHFALLIAYKTNQCT